MTDPVSDLARWRGEYQALVQSRGDELPQATSPTAFYGAIAAAAGQHQTMTEIWSNIYQYAIANEVRLPEGMFTATSTYRGIASQSAYAAERLTRAPDSYAIEGNMIGRELYQRTAEEKKAVAALYHARFEMHYVENGQDVITTRTLDYGPTIPATVGELRADVEAYAAGLGDAYSVEYTGVGVIQLGAY